MQKGSHLTLCCSNCQESLPFSLSPKHSLTCPHCKAEYIFEDQTLRRHLHLFEALCQQIHASEEILSHASIGVDIGEHHVKIPFRLLLTRFNSCLDLSINGKSVTIKFRTDTMEEAPNEQTR